MGNPVKSVSNFLGMRVIKIAISSLCIFFGFAFSIGASNWPSFRGPGATGVGAGPLPAVWNADTTAGPLRNIRWKTPIPGLSHSSPILWKDRLYVTTAVSAQPDAPLEYALSVEVADDNGEQSWIVYCLDIRTGVVLWQQVAHRGAPRARRHVSATHDNTTLSTDGKRLVAFFGSEGLYAYSMDGTLLWEKDLGVMDMAPSHDREASYGFSSSPALFEDTIVVQCDAKNDGFAAAFAAEDGRELWRIAREEVSVGSWGSPTVMQTAGRTQVVMNGYPWIASYDYKSGEELWRLKSAVKVPVPTPFLADGLIYVGQASPDGDNPLYAIRPDASGDISLAEGASANRDVVWSQKGVGDNFQTPLVDGGIIYFTTPIGVLRAYDAKTGERVYQKRLGTGPFMSSPVAAGERIYVSSTDGKTYVVKRGRTFELVGKNTLGESLYSTPAIGDGALYFHTRGHVVAVAE
jgi:outer membrane protein assembly factor BamB